MCRSQAGRVKWQAGHNRDTRPGVAGRTEKKLMLEQFPEQYADDMKRRKMLLPFVF